MWSCLWLILYRTLNWLIIMLYFLPNSLWPGPKGHEHGLEHSNILRQAQRASQVGSTVLPRLLFSRSFSLTLEGPHPVHFIAWGKGAVSLVYL